MITDNNRVSQYLFPIAEQYPLFFNQNLIDPNRVIKIVSGRYCWIRAFYFQLFKIMFQIQENNGRIKELEDVLVGAAQNVMKDEKNEWQYEKVQQLINTISVFINHVNGNQEIEFEQCIDENKNIDEVLVVVFESIINQSVYKDASVYEKLKYLGKYFRETMSYFQMGIKYEQSDTFLYIQNEQDIYLAYLNITELEEQADQSNNQQQHSQQQQYINENIQQQQIQNEKKLSQNIPKASPVEYLFTKKYRSEGQNIEDGKEEKNKELHELNPYNQGFKDTMQMGIGIREYQQDGNSQQKMKIKGKNVEESQQKKQSIVYHYQEVGKDRFGKPPEIQSKVLNKEELFYKPAQKVSMQNLIKNNVDSNISNQVKKDKKDPLDWINEEEKGTFYRKFTDTKILNLVAEPYRTKVKMLKNRFVGIHSHRLNY